VACRLPVGAYYGSKGAGNRQSCVGDGVYQWFLSLDPEARSLVVACLSSAVGAVVGALIKGFFSRNEIESLKELLEETKSERRAAIEGREKALQERESALRQLYQREAENKEKQRRLDELDQTINGRAITIEAKKTKLDQLLTTLRGTETGIWTTHPRMAPFADFESRVARRKPIIITITNLKGGVGKTTLSGNLLAYFDRKLHKRVLGIDLDYQGSLSTMLRSERAGAAQERKSKVNELLAPLSSHTSLGFATRALGDRLVRSELVPAFYELAQLEDRLLIEWLLQEGGDDVRYRLARVLLQDRIQEKYDVILIDVPPRLTTGTINALCASTHVLVPAIFNRLAAEPVENFLTMSKALMDQLNPKLEFLGVVETMSPRANEGQDARAEGRRVISEALQRFNPVIPILSSDIPRRACITDGVAYLKNGKDGHEAKGIFDALGDEISGRVGLEN